MRVDKKRQARIVGVVGITRKMDFADCRERKVGEGTIRVEAVIGRADEHVVDVEQQAAARPADDLGQKLRLADRGLGEGDVGRRVLQENRALERGLDDLDVLADPVQRLVRVGQGQEIVEKGAPCVDQARCSETSAG